MIVKLSILKMLFLTKKKHKEETRGQEKRNLGTFPPSSMDNEFIPLWFPLDGPPVMLLSQDPYTTTSSPDSPRPRSLHDFATSNQLNL